MQQTQDFSQLFEILRDMQICTDVVHGGSDKTQIELEEECKKLARELMSYDQEAGDLLLLVSLWSRYRRNNSTTNKDLLQYMDWLIKNPNKTH